MHHRYFRRNTESDRQDRATKTSGNDEVAGLRFKAQVPCQLRPFRFNDVAVSVAFDAAFGKGRFVTETVDLPAMGVTGQHQVEATLGNPAEEPWIMGHQDPVAR